MQVRILGSGAGGGFPQWNCACPNCAAFRANRFRGSPRTQTQIAIRAEPHPESPWLLVNASPDLRSQILGDPDFWPRKTPRHSPIASVVLTGAEIDQALGLLHLREFQPLVVFCTSRVQSTIRNGNSLFRALNTNEDQVTWKIIDVKCAWSAFTQGGPKGGLTLKAIPLDGRVPSYYAETAPNLHSSSAREHEEVIALSVECGGKKVLCAPNLATIDEGMIKAWNDYDAVLVDGTFWSNDELIRLAGSKKTAREIGHVPISGREGSLARLADLKRARKIFIHINNTNPILNEESDEYKQAIFEGWEIAFDGMEINL